MRKGFVSEGRLHQKAMAARGGVLNKALTRQFFKRISAGDLSAVDELVADDYVEHEQVPGLAPGKAGVRSR